MADEIAFTVYGKPIPEGALKAFPVRHKDGKMGVSMMHSKTTELYLWRESIAQGYLKNGGGYHDKGIPIGINVIIYFTKPKSAPKKRVYPVTRTGGDIDHHARSVLDALTGIAYADDSQVVDLSLSQRFCGLDERERAEIIVIAME